ncbi:hypothetical protein [Streptomyces sp. NPDC057554]|uniref:hypothetical protein n=1 Tax=Streptomyces sp. NPDC057554 TaxID=3350538 RepID=UPI0036B5FA3B
MGNSVAYPVLRTTDAAEAYAQAVRLCELLEKRDDEVLLHAELFTVEDVRRMAAVLPEGPFDYLESRRDPATGDFADFDLDVSTAGDAALEAELPLSVMAEAPLGTVEERFVRALGRGVAGIDWEGRWPDEPEFDSYGHATYDGVSIAFNGDTAAWGERADHHTVFVHVDKYGDLSRAKRLAASIGSTVLGAAQRGW